MQQSSAKAINPKGLKKPYRQSMEVFAERTENDFSSQDLRGQSFVGRNLSKANFRGAILKNCDFTGCDLSFADFSNADLYRANFSSAKLYVTLFRGADLTRADFTNAKLYGIKLFDSDVTRCRFDPIVIEERTAKSSADYEKAAEIYNTLKRALKEHGEIIRAAHYYYRQRVCQRKSKSSRLVRALELIFLDWLIGYGEKPIRSVYWSAVWIILFSIVYLLLPHLGIGAVINTAHSSYEILSSVHHIPLAIEFSIIAFVGADLIDWDVIGIARLFTSLEALIGIIMLSIILIGFSRKIVRD